MLLQVDPGTFALNMFLILGAIILLGIGLVLFVKFWTGIKAWIAERRQHKSWEGYCQQKRQPDGRPMPPCTAGFCDQCGQSNQKIYYPQTGPPLCPECYDSFCLRQKAEADQARPR